MTTEQTPQDVLREMRPFVLRRVADVSGVSGTGDVAEGVAFSDGTTVLRWLRAGGSTGVYDSLERMEAIHGHDGNTEIVFLDKAITEAPDSPRDELHSALSGAARDLLEQRSEAWSLILHAEQIHGCNHTAQIRATFAIPGAVPDTLSEKPGLDVERLTQAIDEAGTATWDDDPRVMRKKYPSELARDVALIYDRLASTDSEGR